MDSPSSSPGRGKECYHANNFQTSYGANLASYPKDIGGDIIGSKAKVA